MTKAETKTQTKAKYQIVSDALLADIEGGKLQPGDRLPSEDQLVSDLGFSLGTVQRALRDLVDLGVVKRVHGSGTFVSGARPPEAHLRHFRFKADDGKSLLPVFFETDSLELTQAKGPWSQFLGEDAKGYVRISRLVSVNREFEIFSELYLPATRFAPLLQMEPSDLDGVSIRDMLADKLNTPTVHTTQTMLCTVIPPRAARQIEIPVGMFGLILTIQSETFRHAPIIWQRAYVPPSDREMEMLSDPQ